jgi:hypothetical protein
MMRGIPPNYQLMLYGIWVDGVTLAASSFGLLTTFVTWVAMICGVVMIVCSKRVPLRFTIRYGAMTDHEHQELRRLRRQKHEWQEQEWDRSLHMDDRIALSEPVAAVGDIRASIDRKTAINGYLAANDALIEQNTAWGYSQLAVLGAQLNVAWYCELAEMGVDVCAMLGIEQPGQPVKVQRSLWEVPILSPEAAQERALERIEGDVVASLSVPPADVSEPEPVDWRREHNEYCQRNSRPLSESRLRCPACNEEYQGRQPEVTGSRQAEDIDKINYLQTEGAWLEAENRKLQRQLSAMQIKLTDAGREVECARVDAQKAVQETIYDMLQNRSVPQQLGRGMTDEYFTMDGY